MFYVLYSHAIIYIVYVLLMRFLRPGWIILYILVIVVGYIYLGSPHVSFDGPLEIKEGDTLTSILEDQGSLNARRIRRAAGSYDFDPAGLEVGQYADLSGTLSVADFYKYLSAGPRAEYQKITILESRSIYDTDAYLTKKGYITKGEYIAYVTNVANIRDRRTEYSFLKILPTKIKTLEGFLYPETYHVDANEPIIPQLVKLQLKGFYENIRLRWGNELIDGTRRKTQNMSSYEMLILASVVLKEERNTKYQSLVAGVFRNRIQKGMRLGADVTLCYGLKKPYAECPPSVIVQNLQDKKNIYNTRMLTGLPPTAISSLTPTVVGAVINVESHDYLYYLHDKNGKIHPAKDIAGHQKNKTQYLR